MRKLRIVAMTAALAAISISLTASSSRTDRLQTVAEQSQWVKTGRYDEVVSLCRRFELAYPSRVSCQEFGTTPEGRPMLSLVVSGDGLLAPEANRAANRPVVFFQGGIHAGEIDGKDAGFYLLRELLEGRALSGVLSRVTLVFVPVFNIDGHERFGPNNRPNQTGPEEMGWRTSAYNLNLNRDYMKIEAPEMDALHRYLLPWDPILRIDLHATNGAQFQHDIAVMFTPQFLGEPEIVRTADRIESETVSKLNAQGHLALPFYPTFRTYDEPASGVEEYESPPRNSNGYWALRNRFGVLVETHSWKDYAARVRATINALTAMIELAGRDGETWQRIAREADDAASRLDSKKVSLFSGTTAHFEMIDFQGYVYDRVKSDVSGALMTRYHPDKPQVWRMPYYRELRPTLTIQPPRGGYVVPAASAGWMKRKLDAHGVQYRAIGRVHAGAELQTFRAKEIKFADKSYEGRSGLRITGEWAAEKRDVPAGSIFIPINQPLSRLVLHLFEPTASDSFLAWGFFNAYFERKEYMEDYVAEAVAEQMLKDPKVRAEFEHKLKEDPAFAASLEQRLEFFYRRHPSWDERYALYPVYRTDQVGF